MVRQMPNGMNWHCLSTPGSSGFSVPSMSFVMTTLTQQFISSISHRTLFCTSCGEVTRLLLAKNTTLVYVHSHIPLLSFLSASPSPLPLCVYVSLPTFCQSLLLSFSSLCPRCQQKSLTMTSMQWLKG